MADDAACISRSFLRFIVMVLALTIHTNRVTCFHNLFRYYSPKSAQFGLFMASSQPSNKERIHSIHHSAGVQPHDALINALKSNDEVFVKYLHKLAQRKAQGYSFMTGPDRKALLQNIEHRLPTMIPTNVANLCWALGTLRLPPRSSGMVIVTDLMLERLDGSSSHLAASPADLTQALVGLARLNVVVRPSRDSFLGHSLHVALPMMDAHQVANCVWALGKIGLGWDALPLKMRRAIGDAVSRVCNVSYAKGTSFTPQGIANTLYGLSQLRAKWALLPAHVTQGLTTAVAAKAPLMNEQEISNTLSGLGRLGAEWSALPVRLREMLDKALYKNLREAAAPMGAQGLAMSLHGLGRMNAVFSSMSLSSRRALYGAIASNGGLLNDIEVSNVLYGLGRMGCKFPANQEKLSSPDALESGLAKVSTTISPAEKNRDVRSTSQASFKLQQKKARKDREPKEPSCILPDGAASSDENYLAVSAKQALEQAIERESWRLTAQGASNSLWGFMLLNSSWAALPLPTRQAILRAITRESLRMDEQELGSVIYSMGKMGCKWSDLPTALQSELLASLEQRAAELVPAGIAMTLLGLGRMRLEWDSFPSALHDGMEEALVRVLRSQSHGQGQGGHTVSAVIHALSTTQCQWESMGGALQSTILEAIARVFWVQQSKAVPTPTSTAAAAAPMLTNYSAPDTDSGTGLTLSALMGLKSSAAAALILSGASAKPQKKLRADPKGFKTPSTPPTAPSSIGITPKVSRADVLDSFDAATSWPPILQGYPVSASDKSPMSLGPEVEGFSSDIFSPSLAAPVGHGHGHRDPLVLSLATMKVKWDTLGIGTQQGLMTSMTRSLNPSWDSALATSNGGVRVEGFVGALKGLSLLGASWVVLQQDLQSEICLAVRRLAPYMDSAAISSVILHLSELSVQWEELDEVKTRKSGNPSSSSNRKGTQAALRNAILRQATFGPEALSQLLLGLGQLRHWADLPLEVRHCLGTALVESQLGHDVLAITPIGIERSLHGLAMMRCVWMTDLSSSARMALLASMHKTIPHCSAQQVSEIISSLGNLEAPLAQLPDQVRTALLERLAGFGPNRAEIASLSEQVLAGVLSGLAGMGADWYSLPSNVQSGLLHALSHIFSRPASGVASASRAACLVGLGKLGAKWHSLPRALVSDVQTAFLSDWSLISSNIQFQRLNAPSAHLFASWATGLAKMGFRYSELSSAMQTELKDALVSLSKSNPGTGHNSASKSKAGVSSKCDAPPALMDVSMILNSLGVLGLSCRDPEIDAPKTALLSLAMKVCFEGEPAEIVAAMLGVSLMDFSWAQLPAETRLALTQGVLRATQPKRSSTACKVEAFWLLHAPEEPPQPSCILLSKDRHKEKPCSFSPLRSTEMCPSVCATLMHSVSLLVFDSIAPIGRDAIDRATLHSELRPLHAALTRTVSSVGVNRFSEREKEQIIVYSQLLSGVDGGIGPVGSDQSIDGEHGRHFLRADLVVNSPELCNEYRTFTSDTLQHAVVASVNSALTDQGHSDSLIVSQDFSPFFGAMPVDATIVDRTDGHILAFIEIDPPSHYTARGELRRVDQLKETLYRQLHPTAPFVRCGHMAVRNCGERQVGVDVARFLSIVRSHSHRAGNISLEDLYGSTWTDGWVKRRALTELRTALSGQRSNGS